MADSNDVLDGLKVKNLGEDGFGCAEDDAQADAPLECGTLAIDNDDFMCAAAVDEECTDGIVGVRGAEDESMGHEQLLTLTMEERVAYLEGQLRMVCVDVEKIKSRVKDVIEVQNGMTIQPGNDGRNVVTSAEFEKMLDAAMSSGMKYGVSRSYITRFICSEYNQENSRYFQKKLGLLLKKKLMSKEYLFNDSLYSVNVK